MRWLRHLFAPSASSVFSPNQLQRIAAAVTEGERLHGGQVMFAVESDLPLTALWKGVSARQRADHAFALLRTWDTERNNGVLVYLLLADHAIEIVADRGLHEKVTEEQWAEVCNRLRQGLQAGVAEQAVLTALTDVAVLLAGHYPPLVGETRHNELPDMPQLLD